MSSSRFSHLGFGIAFTLVVSVSWGIGCEDSSTSDPPNVAFEGGLGFDSGAGNTDGGIAGPGDASEGGTGTTSDSGSISADPGIYLANLFGSPIDFCFRPPGASAFTGPVFNAQGGVPNRAVSVHAPLPPESFVVLIAQGAGCEATPIFTGGTVTSNATPLLTLVVRGGTISDGRVVFLRPQQHVAGKDNIYYGRQARDARFAPSGGGTAIPVADDRPTALDPGMTGQLELTTSTNTVTLPMKTAAGIALLLDGALPDTTPLLCDMLAPPTGHLLVCGATVRAP